MPFIGSEISRLRRLSLHAGKLAKQAVKNRHFPIRMQVRLYSSNASNLATEFPAPKVPARSCEDDLEAPHVSSSTKDLPEETMYIIDGTSMLFQAFHSREHAYQYAGVTLAEPLAAMLRAELKLDMMAYRAEAAAALKKTSAAKGERSAKAASMATLQPVNTGAQTVAEEGDERLFCGALVVMALNFVRFVRDVRPKYVAVAFDAGRKTFRNEMYVMIWSVRVGAVAASPIALMPPTDPALRFSVPSRFDSYKKTRLKPPLALAPLFDLAPQVLTRLGARCFQQVGYEADDVMASLSRWARQRDLHVVHVSNDKDMLQLVDSCVYVLNPSNRDSLLTGAQEVLRKYKVPARQLVDYLALVGDSADNISGVRGVGPKQAVALLRHFGSIDGIISTLALPAESVDLTCRAAVEAAGLSLFQVPVKVRKTRREEPAAAPAETLWKVQFHENSLQEVMTCMRSAGNYGDPAKLLAKLVQTGAAELRLFQTLVRLHTDLAPSSMALGGAPLQEELTTAYFCYAGERASGSPLTAISAGLGGAAAMLRRNALS